MQNVVTYIKKEELNSLEFQPVTKEAKRRVAVWDTYNKKFLNAGASFTLENKTVVPVDSWASKTLREKGSEKDKAQYAVKETFQREVIVGTEHKMLELPYSADQMLLKIMERETEPLAWTYIVEKTGNGLQTRYMIFKGDKVGEVAPVQKPIKAPTEVKTCNGVDLTPKQIEVINTYKTYIFTENLDMSKDNVRTSIEVGLMENGFAKELARAVIDEHLR